MQQDMKIGTPILLKRKIVLVYFPRHPAHDNRSDNFLQRFIDKTTLTVYPTADSSNASKDLHFYYVKRIQDADSTYTDATDVPYRFVPCMVSGLAFYLAQKFAPDRIQSMKLYYEDEFQRALSEDGSPASTYITPKTYYPNV